MKQFFILLPAAIIVSFSYAQSQPANLQTPCTTALQGTAGNVTVSYTIGEMTAVESLQKNGLLITQGVLQPLQNGNANPDVYDCFSQSEIKVYPNPNPGIFTLQLSLLKKGSIKTMLVDAAGKLIQTDLFSYNSFTTKKYDINRLANGIYFLQIFFTAEGELKERKCNYSIQKTN